MQITIKWRNKKPLAAQDMGPGDKWIFDFGMIKGIELPVEK